MTLLKNSLRPTTNEKILKTSCLRWIKREYPEIWVCKLSDRFISGIPDILLMFKGQGLFIELKATKGKASRIQQYVFAEIEDTGTTVLVIRSLYDFQVQVKQWRQCLKETVCKINREGVN